MRTHTRQYHCYLNNNSIILRELTMTIQHPVTKQNPPLGIIKAMHDLIWTSIENRHHVSFIYDGKRRIAEAHDYSLQNGRVRLLVYQFAGESNSGRLPAWRLVDVD